MKRLFLLAIAAGLLTVPSALASDGTLSVSPSSPHVGDSLVFSGCGYTAGEEWYVVVAAPNKKGNATVEVDTDATGCLTTAAAPYVARYSGVYRVYVVQVVGFYATPALTFTVG